MMVFSIEGDDRQYKCPESPKDVTLGKYVSFLRDIAPQEPAEIAKLQEYNYRINELMDDLQKWVAKVQQQPKELSVDETLDLLTGYLNGEPTIKATQYLPPIIKELSEVQKKQMAIVDKMTAVWYAKNLIPYMAKTVAHFTGVTYAKIMGAEGIGMTRKALEYLYDKISRACAPKEASEYKRTYLINGEVYELPERFMQNSTLIEFAEAAQFQENADRVNAGQAEALIDVISVIMRKPGEMYSEEVYNRNRKTFEQMSLDDALEVAFFLKTQSDTYVTNFVTSTTVRLAEVVKMEQTSQERTVGTSRSKPLQKVVYSIGRMLRR
jgi:hypothetical protein